MRALVAGLACAAAATAWARPNTPGTTEIFRYAAGDAVESFASAGGHFKVFFTRTGANAVPDADEDDDGTPDAVEEVADLYEEVLAFYQGLGFRAPVSDASSAGDNGGDGRFDVYLLDFAGRADGSFQRESCDAAGVCAGFMVQENDFAGYGYPSRTYGNRVLASHELFHAVQAAYDSGESSIFGEGSAVWATERFDPSLNDLESFARGYLDRPGQSLYVPLPGPVDPFSYGAGLFFQFLDERHGDGIIRDLWEAAAGAPGWFDVLDGVLAARGSSFADAFFTFARWNLFTRTRANPALAWARGQGYPLVKMEPGTAPLSIASLRVFPASTAYLAVPPAGRSTFATSLAVPAGVDGSPLRLALAVRRGDVVSEPTLADATLAAEVDAAGADEVIVVVVNTARSGESLRPGVCAGAPDEVAACLAELGAPVEMMPAEMGGCTFTPASRSASATAITFVLLALALALLRRRHV